MQLSHRRWVEGVNRVSCGNLYRAMGGYEAAGGRYDAAQRALALAGWTYRIEWDAWFAPSTSRPH